MAYLLTYVAYVNKVACILTSNLRYIYSLHYLFINTTKVNKFILSSINCSSISFSFVVIKSDIYVCVYSLGHYWNTLEFLLLCIEFLDMLIKHTPTQRDAHHHHLYRDIKDDDRT